MKRAPGSPTKAERRRIGRRMRKGKIITLTEARELALRISLETDIRLQRERMADGWFARHEAHEREKPLPPYVWTDQYVFRP